jgi:alpha-tubulin suppressor-like RCC1 family protein
MSIQKALTAVTSLVPTTCAENDRDTRLRMSVLLLAVVGAAQACAVSTNDGPDAAEQEAQQATGTATGTSSSTSKYAADLTVLTEITAGGDHTCVRRLDGRYYCWGREYNLVAPYGGQLCSGLPCTLKPTYGGTGAKQITAGYTHTCVRSTNGNSTCWGDDGLGELASGAGVTGSGSFLTRDSSGTPLVFSSISAGTYSTCGVAAGTGNVLCWGAVVGGLGVPTLIQTSGTPFAGVDSVATGSISACATWVSPNPDNVGFTNVNANGNAMAFVAFGPLTVKRIAGQDDFFCADMSNGTVECFGDNSVGQLGGGTTSPASTTVVGGGMALHGVTVGTAHACALDATGQAYCWGAGTYNQLGHITSGTPTDSATPVTVASGAVRFSALAAGEHHTCGIGTNGHVYCWGDNEYGQTGINYIYSPPTLMAVTQTVDPPK